MIPRKNGFTLIEMLFVLSICSIIITLSVPLIFSTLEKQEEKRFLETFEFDVLYMQNLSIGKTDGYLRIEFYEDNYSILNGTTDETLLVRNYPKHVTVTINTWAMKSISFNKNGVIKFPGNVSIVINNTEYILVFPLGKGRFYIDEQ